MNKQRKVLITVTYNEMGIIIDTKAEEVAQPNSIPPVNPQEPKTGWIPVSERLPEDRREVLVTAYWHETYQVMMASYYGDGLWWCVPFNNCGEHMQRLQPKAWMPLPKSYEPQESEGECKNCEYYRNPDYTRCHECKAESEDRNE